MGCLGGGGGGGMYISPPKTHCYSHWGIKYQRVCTLRTLNVPRKPMEHRSLLLGPTLHPQDTRSSSNLFLCGTFNPRLDGDVMLPRLSLLSPSPQGHLSPWLLCPTLPVTLLHHPDLF